MRLWAILVFALLLVAATEAWKFSLRKSKGTQTKAGPGKKNSILTKLFQKGKAAWKKPRTPLLESFDNKVTKAEQLVNTVDRAKQLKDSLVSMVQNIFPGKTEESEDSSEPATAEEADPAEEPAPEAPEKS